MWIFIQPTDVWLFRDGRPFDAGSDHRARSLFPPTPFTLQGAIRAKVLMERSVSLSDYAYDQKEEETRSVAVDIGSPSTGYGRLQLRGPIVARAEKPEATPTQFFPAPADLMHTSGKPMVLRPLKNSPFKNNLPGDRLPLWNRSVELREEYENLWLRTEEMCSYLEHEILTSEEITRGHLLYERESRFHVGIDSAVKRPVEGDTGGHLFQIEFVRLCEGVGLLLEVGTMDGNSLPYFPDSSLLQLGGESRSAFYEKVDDVARVDLISRKQALQEGRFKLVFITPAYFEAGWQPSNGDWSRFFKGTGIRLISATFSRAQSIGGARADLKSQRGNKGESFQERFQKPLRRFVPAGSVYFFEADGPVSYNDCPVTETPPGEADFGQIGFGQILIGRWSYV
jgi:CRISPR-associated protein Cmr3